MDIKHASSAPTAASTLLSQSLEAFQSLEIDGNRVIISTLDTLPIGAGTPLGHDYSQVPQLWIFAESLTLADSFAMRNGVLAVHQLNVAVPPGRLDLTGAAGSTAPGVNLNTGRPGPDGGQGAPGGSFYLYLESAGSAEPAFAVSVRGGAGGAGQNGNLSTPGASGGNGGDGGNAVIVAGVPMLNWLTQLRQIHELTTLAAKREAIQELLARIPADPPFTAVRANLRTAADATSDALLTDGMRLAGRQLQVLASGFSAGLTASVDVSGGTYGTYGEGSTPGKNGRPGARGRLESVLVGTPREVVTETFSPFFLAHPSQCARLLERARLQYLVLDPVNHPRGVSDLTVLLLRLQARTQIFVDAADTSQLVAYYNDNESRIGAVGAVDQLRALNSQATQYLGQLRQGLDLFGNEGSYVPLASFGAYKDGLDQRISIFEKLEASYEGYFSSLGDVTTQMRNVEAARDQQHRIVDTAQSQLALLEPVAERTASVIAGYQVSLPPLKRALDDAMAAARERISTAFNFDFEQVVQAVSMLAFAPESQFMMVTQLGGLLYNSTTRIANDQGVPVRVDYVVSQIKAVEADVDGLAEGYRQLADGTLAPDDPGAGKLVAQEQKLTEFLAQFSGSFPEELTAVQKAFDAYVAQVVARNNQILSYNATLLLMVRNRQIIDQGGSDLREKYDRAIETMSPQLPDLTTFVSGLYYTARAQAMEMLSLTSRAFRFWALSDTNLLAQALGDRTPSQIGSTELRAAQNTILDAYLSAIQRFGTSPSVFPAQPAQPGLVMTLTPEQVETLKSFNELMVTVRTVTLATTRDQSVFAGMANIRVMSIRVWIDGAKTSSGPLQVGITHTGKEQIVSPTGTVFNFSHQPVAKQFIYEPSSMTVVEEANFGLPPDASGLPASVYAAPGPFTTWRIKVSSRYNSGLDLSGVTNIRLEFRGTNFAFT